MKIVEQKYITEKDCFDNPKSLYLFGDNLRRTGKKGQAQIRDCLNSFGVATKHKPSTTDDSYFTDDDIDYVYKDLTELSKLMKSGFYDTLVIPSDGIGTGLAKLQEKAPAILTFINAVLDKWEEKYNG